ncbi:MAG: thioesterase family protein [Acidobacteria bacterium]|nr:thioesterase family protein [Acidobacteriota bacterium]
MSDLEVGSLVEVLDLEELDDNLYRGLHRPGSLEKGRLFGGQVAAQALAAAARTVEPARRPHSLHGYFLRSGRPDRPVVLRVERDRDGGSFSARRVVALQGGDEIFMMLSSFHVEEPSPDMDFQVAMPPGVPIPDSPGDTAVEALGNHAQLFDTRSWGEASVARDGQRVSSRLWTRARETLPDDPIIHACALTYASDFGGGFAEVGLPPLAAAASLDHAVWFHQHVRVDDWILMDLWPLKVGGSRGVYSGSMFGADGSLGAMLTQEMLLRPAPRQRE